MKAPKKKHPSKKQSRVRVWARQAWTWLGKHIQASVWAVCGLALAIIVVVLTGPHLSADVRHRYNQMAASKGVPSFLLFSEVVIEVQTGTSGYGFIALAFEKARRSGSVHIESAPDLERVRICEPTTVVSRDYEAALREILARYPNCFNVTLAPGKMAVAPASGLVLDRGQYWCRCSKAIVNAAP